MINCRTLQKHLHFKPYKLARIQQITDADSRSTGILCKHFGLNRKLRNLPRQQNFYLLVTISH